MSYTLTILIPTKNRLHYLKGALNCINAIESSEIEVIVQDNSDDWQPVSNYIKSLGNSDIKYYYAKDRLSQTENSELAAEKATGQFVCYIGDDDTVCKSMLTLAKCMGKYNIDSAVYGIANYNWPDLLEVKPELPAFIYRDVKDLRIEKMNPQDNLIRALHMGMLNIKKLPRVYHGIVSKRLLDKVKENAGVYFPGPSPDMANATSCSLYAMNEIRINMPMIIDGYGKSSAGGMGQRKLHRGSLKGNFQLSDDVETKWDPKIPKLWMQDTIWPNSAMKALEACGREEMKRHMNYHAVYCDTYLHDRRSCPAIKECEISVLDLVETFGCFVNKCMRKIRTVITPGEYIETKISESITIEKAFELQNKENSKHDIEAVFIKEFDRVNGEK